MPWRARLKNKPASICLWSINKDELKASLSLSGISFGFWTRSASFLPSLHLLCSCQTRPKGGVGSTWARVSGLPPISRHLPAWYQSTLYSLPTERQPTLKETEGGRGVMEKWDAWKRGEEKKKGRRDKRDRNRGAEWGKESRKAGFLVAHPKFTSALRLPVAFNSCSVKGSVPLLSPETCTLIQTHTRTQSQTETGTVPSYSASWVR